MAWLAADLDGSEWIFNDEPFRDQDGICWDSYDNYGDSLPVIKLPKGSISKLIGRDLTWMDEPVDLNGII